MKFDMELVKVIGKGTKKYGGLIIVEGIKSVLGQSAVRVINTSMDEGFGAVKKLSFDDIVGITDNKKMKLFGKKVKKDKTEEPVEEYEPVKDIIDDKAETIDIDDDNVVILDKKKQG